MKEKDINNNKPLNFTLYKNTDSQYFNNIDNINNLIVNDNKIIKQDESSLEKFQREIISIIDSNKQQHPNISYMYVIDAEYIKDVIKVKLNKLKNDVKFNASEYLVKEFGGFVYEKFTNNQINAICHFAECFTKKIIHENI